MHLKSLRLIKAGFHQFAFNPSQTQLKHTMMNYCLTSFGPSNSRLISLMSRNKLKVSKPHNIKEDIIKMLNYRSRTPSILVLMVCNSFKNIPKVLKNHSVKIIQNCVQNCEFVLAHRVRRSQQVISLYAKLWDEVSFWQFMNRLRLQLIRPRTFFLLGSSFVSSYDWDKERIPDEDILRYSAEMSLIEFLRDKRNACLKGNSRPSDCNCPVCAATDSEWRTFVEEEDIVVWKREDVNHRGKGLYCYKMYARYEDVTAYDFLEAQVDLDYRRTWDTHAVQLRLIDSEPKTNSDVIYWETKWPTLFSNRDYVFKRRYRIDKKRNLIYLVNRLTQHPACPVLPSKQRVSEYWSYMVIKPHTTFDKPGLEFSLTYFDNPGLNVPSSLTLWVTVSGMPDFLKRLRLAAHGVAERRGGAPSPLASRDTNLSTDNGDNGAPAHVDRRTSTAVLLESLRGTLFLF